MNCLSCGCPASRCSECQEYFCRYCDELIVDGLCTDCYEIFGDGNASADNNYDEPFNWDVNDEYE